MILEGFNFLVTNWELFESDFTTLKKNKPYNLKIYSKNCQYANNGFWICNKFTIKKCNII